MDKATCEQLESYFMDYWCSDDQENKALAQKWNAEISEQARELHDSCIIIDGCTFYVDSYNWQLREARPTALNMTVPSVYDPSVGGFIGETGELLSVIRKFPEHFINILTADDIVEAKRTGKVGFIIGAQNCDFVLSRDYAATIELLARMGLRIMQIGYHTRSFAADGCAAGTDAGLTEHGRKLIRAMERSGITVDLSHVGCRSTLEAMEFAEKPMIFSHSNPKALFNHFRNITDEQAKKCAAIGGVIGVVGFTPILWDGKRFPSVERFVDAVSYYADLVGIDHVGIGLDSNAEPGAYNRADARNIAAVYCRDDSPYSPYEQGYKEGRGKASVFTDGIYGVASYPNIVDKLLKRGFSEADVRKVMGENFLRVFRETWK